MAVTYPQIEPLTPVAANVVADEVDQHRGRAGCAGTAVILSAFGTVTGRSTPSNAKFIFGLPSWTRGLIKPAEGMSLVYCRLPGAGIWHRSRAIEGSAHDHQLTNLAIRISGLRSESALSHRMLPGQPTARSANNTKSLWVWALGMGCRLRLWARGSGSRSFTRLNCCVQHHETFRQFWRWSNGILRSGHGPQRAAHRLRLAHSLRRRQEGKPAVDSELGCSGAWG